LLLERLERLDSLFHQSDVSVQQIVDLLARLNRRGGEVEQLADLKQRDVQLY